MAVYSANRAEQSTYMTPMLKINSYEIMRPKSAKNRMAVGVAVCCEPTRGSNCNPVSFSCLKFHPWKTARIAVTSISHTLPQTARFRLLFDFGYFPDFSIKSRHGANVVRIFKSYGTEQNLTVFTNLYLRKKSHSVKKSKESEKRGWKFYPPSELVRMPLKIFSTF